MKIFSTFTGIGGFEIGIHNAYRKYAHNFTETRQTEPDQNLRQMQFGETLPEMSRSTGGERPIVEPEIQLHAGNWTAPLCVGYSEIDRYASSVYEKHYKGVKNYGDITKINAEEIPDFDCLVGGFPCQAFSIAGKRAGFDDTRGTLFFDLARILRAKQPRLFVFENVKGLLSHDKGKTFRVIIKTLDDLGYDCQWQVLNSKNFGVPQNRERIIIVGHLRGTARPKVFPITSNSEADFVLPTLTARYYGAQANGGYISHTQSEIRQVNNPVHSNDRVYDPEGIGPTLNTMQGGRRQPKIAMPVLTPNRIEKRQNGRRMKTNGEPAFTVNTQDRHGIFDGVKLRRLTPLECERLQAFPDDWTKYDKDGLEVSDSQRYKMCGNAVTTNVIQAVFEKIFV